MRTANYHNLDFASAKMMIRWLRSISFKESQRPYSILLNFPVLPMTVYRQLIFWHYCDRFLFHNNKNKQAVRKIFLENCILWSPDNVNHQIFSKWRSTSFRRICLSSGKAIAICLEMWKKWLFWTSPLRWNAVHDRHASQSRTWPWPNDCEWIQLKD